MISSVYTTYDGASVLVYSALLVVVLSLYGVITGMVVLRSQKNQIIAQYRELGRKTVQQLDTFFRDIALSVGYEDPLYFSRLFKKKLGLYPTEFRCRVPKRCETPLSGDS